MIHRGNFLRELRKQGTSAVDLIFATVFSRVLIARILIVNVKSKAAPELYFAGVSLGFNIRKSVRREGMRMLELEHLP